MTKGGSRKARTPFCFLHRYASILSGNSQSTTKENEMENNQPIDVLEVSEKIFNPNDGLALQLHKAIAYRDASSNHSDKFCAKTLSADTKVVRIRSEIVSVMRRYNLKCEHCGDEFILRRWYLVNGETQLKCPKCNGLTHRAKHKESYALTELLDVTPAPLADIFAKEGYTPLTYCFPGSQGS